MSVRIYLRKDIVKFLHHKLKTIPPYTDLDYLNLSKGKLFNYDIDKFYWILDILTNTKQYGLIPNEDGFISLCSKILIDNLGKDYKIYIRYLSNQYFIESNNRYKESTCLKYKICIDKNIDFININNKITYLSIPNHEFKLTKNPINIDNRLILKNRKKIEFLEIKFDINSKIYKKKIIEYELELGRNRRYPSYLKTMSQYYRKNLKINYKEAIEYCHNYIDSKTQKLEHQFNDGKIQIKEFEKGINKVGNQYIQRITSVKNLHYGKKSKSLKFNRNSTNKRIDTNLTFMAKDIRKFIKGVENMSYLDLSNSQPVLFNILLKKYYKNNNEKLNQEIKHYYLITISGNWYEELCDIFRLNYKCTDDRNKAKKIWMKIAYSKNGDYKVLKNKFNKHYPEINSLMEKLKKKCHKDFAIKLQRIESKIFIDEICKTLVEKDIIPYSIHDGVLVPKEYEAKTYHIMIETLKKHLGSVPVISINDEKVYHQTSKEENLMIQFEKHFST